MINRKRWRTKVDALNDYISDSVDGVAFVDTETGKIEVYTVMTRGPLPSWEDLDWITVFKNADVWESWELEEVDIKPHMQHAKAQSAYPSIKPKKLDDSNTSDKFLLNLMIFMLSIVGLVFLAWFVFAICSAASNG